MCAVSGMSNASVTEPPAIPPISSASAGWPRCRPGSRSGSARRGRAAAQLPRPNRRRYRVVIELSSDCITSAITVRSGPSPHREHRQVGQRLARDRAEPAQRPARAAVDERGLQQPHRVRAAAVADRLDVRVRIGMERAGDRDARRRSRVAPAGAPRGTDAPRIASELVRVSSPSRGGQPRQHAGGPHPVQEPLRAERARREDHLVRLDTCAGAGATTRRCAPSPPRTRRRTPAARRRHRGQRAHLAPARSASHR